MELNKIYNQDGFDLLDDLETCSVDLIILDPDYRDWENFCNMGLIEESLRVLKHTGNMLCFTKQPFDFELRKKINFILRREIIWTFKNGSACVSQRLPLVSHQKIYHCVHNKYEHYFDSRTGMSYSKDTKNFQRKNSVFEGYNGKGRYFQKSDDGIWIRDHLHFNKPHTGAIPSKPKRLYDVLIKCYCPDDGLVVEPFSGSGNFVKTCIEQNKNYIGSEINDETYEYSMKRLNEFEKKLW